MNPHAQHLHSFETVAKRWPIIITNIISHVHELIHDMTMESRKLTESGSPDGEALEHAKVLGGKIEEGREVISKCSRLKHRMARDQSLE
jgi:damage-control phosphatase, subfamily III